MTRGDLILKIIVPVSLLIGFSIGLSLMYTQDYHTLGIALTSFCAVFLGIHIMIRLCVHIEKHSDRISDWWNTKL